MNSQIERNSIQKDIYFYSILYFIFFLLKISLLFLLFDMFCENIWFVYLYGRFIALF